MFFKLLNIDDMSRVKLKIVGATGPKIYVRPWPCLRRSVVRGLINCKEDV